MTGEQPAAGWYTDPAGTHEQRHWDGSQWTDEVRDGEQTATDVVAAYHPTKEVVRAQKRDARRARFELMRAPTTYRKVNVVDGHVRTPSGSGPLAGARARLEVTGTVNRRKTVTRMALTGPLAGALPKKQDDREGFLVVAGAGFEHREPVPRMLFERAQAFVSAFNAQAAQVTPVAAPAALTPPPSAGGGEVEQLTKLADLHAAGVLTGEEFAAAKRKVLGL